MEAKPLRYAIAVALGPVGRFISAGRRSRDLWYGSRLLSEMTRQAAGSLWKAVSPTNDCCFWTPRKENLQIEKLPEPLFFSISDMQPHEGPVITNKIRAIVTLPVDTTPEQLLRDAEASVRQWLVNQLEELRQKEGLEDQVAFDHNALVAQSEAILAGDFLEFYAAYAQVKESESKNSDKRALVQAQSLLDARKNTRLFVGASWTQAGHVRSNLEPGRDSILIQFDRRVDGAKELKTRLTRASTGIRTDERLDAIGLVRRIAAMKEERFHSRIGQAECNCHGGRIAAMKEERLDKDYPENAKGQTLLPGLPFPPLARVAADPWLEGIRNTPAKPHLESIRESLKQLEKSGKDSILHLLSSPCREPNNRAESRMARAQQRESGYFPYDPSLLFEGGIQSLQGDLLRLKTDEKRVRAENQAALAQDGLKELQRLGQEVAKLHELAGVPQHYYIYLTADGDGIGAALQGQSTRHDELKLVEQMDQFAKYAWLTVDHQHGFAFYVGADEVAAYLPLDKGLQAAQALTEDFLSCTRTDQPHDPPISLSVGLVVAHVKHDLRDIRRRGEEALHRAKAQRKASGSSVGHIHVIECVAGGADRSAGGPTAEFIPRIQTWMAALEDGSLTLSSVQNLLNGLDSLSSTCSEVELVRVLGLPLLAAKRSNPQEQPDSPFHALLKQFYRELRTSDSGPAEVATSAKDLCHEVLLADRVLKAKRQRTPNDSSKAGGST